MVVPIYAHPSTKVMPFLFLFFCFFACQLFRRKMRTFFGDENQGPSAPPPLEKSLLRHCCTGCFVFTFPVVCGCSFVIVTCLLCWRHLFTISSQQNVYACRENVAYASRKSSYLIERHGNPYNFVTNSLTFVFVPCGFATKSLKL